MDEDNGSGLTPNQQSVLNSRSGGDTYADWGSSGGSFLEGWKMPLGVVSIFTFLGFLLGCIATDMARNNADDIYDLQHKKTATTEACPYGDVLFGSELHETDGSNGGGYQIVGMLGAEITWKQAYQDASSRCYNGKPGYLAIIGSEWENAFIQSLIQDMPDWATDSGGDAWVGGGDFKTEGTWSWIGPKKLIKGIDFYDETDGAIDGSYTNWAPTEPNSGGNSGVDQDCLAMYGGGGKWYDANCYATMPYFVVEFGPPTIDDDAWAQQYDDAIDDDTI